MTTLTVFDPAMCCNTGVCGPEVDSKLVQFAADLDWLKTLGVDVIRINLSQEPAAFVQNDKVKSVLDNSGVDGLPAIMLENKLISSGRYPARGELAEMTGIDYTPAADEGVKQVENKGCCGDKEPEETATGCC